VVMAAVADVEGRGDSSLPEEGLGRRVELRVVMVMGAAVPAVVGRGLRLAGTGDVEPELGRE